MSVRPNESGSYASADFKDTWTQNLGKIIQGANIAGSGNGFLQDIHSERAVGYIHIPEKFYHPTPTRNALGLVGGNEVSTVDTIVDLESDLRGITRATTKCSNRQWRPECPLGGEKACPDWPSGVNYNAKDQDNERRFIATRPLHLSESQLVSYQGVQFPKSFTMRTGTTYRF